jgi:hypothetical protein
MSSRISLSPCLSTWVTFPGSTEDMYLFVSLEEVGKEGVDALDNFDREEDTVDGAKAFACLARANAKHERVGSRYFIFR